MLINYLIEYLILHFKLFNMNSLFSHGFLLLLFYFLILFMNLVVFVFSIFLLIINNQERKKKQIQLYQLSIGFQMGICCILHSISFFIIYPYNEEYPFLSAIQAFLNITSLLECINIIASKFYFCYLYSKESQKYKENSVLLGQIILSWIIPIIYGLICVRYGDIEVIYATFFSWVGNDNFMYAFTSLFGISFFIALYFTCKINSGMHEVVRGTNESGNSNYYHSLLRKIRINYITLFFSLIVFSFDIIKQLIENCTERVPVFFNYLDCIFENVLIVSFCFYFGYEESKRKEFMIIFCCKKTKEDFKEGKEEDIIPDPSISEITNSEWD